MSLKWRQSPQQAAAGVRSARAGLPQAIAAVAQSHASRLEGQMKTEAAWVDRTGAARGGLFGVVVVAGNIVSVYLGGTEEHNIYLELGTYKMAPRAIIGPTLQAGAGPLMQDAATVMRRVMGA